MERPTRSSTFQRPRLREGLLAAAVALAIALLATGSAAQLNVNTHVIDTFSAARCSGTTLSAHTSPTGFNFSTNRNAVQITNYPAACNGLTVNVDVRNGAGTQLATGSATCSGSPCVISTTTYNVTAPSDMHVQAGSWGMPTNWDTTCSRILFWYTCT